MISPEDIRKKVERYWRSGQLLRCLVGAEKQLFPLSIPFKKPSAKQLLHEFVPMKQAITLLEAHSKTVRGFGYRLEYEQRKHQQRGEQRLPARIIFDQVDDVLCTLGRTKEAAPFVSLTETIVASYPQLQPWLLKNCLRVLEYAQAWPGILATMARFVAGDTCHLYLRQLDIIGVDTKFIERHQRLIAELLDQVLPEERVNRAVNLRSAGDFAQRYGLRFDRPMVRLRFLDPTRATCFGSHVTDFAIPLNDFQELAPSCQRVFITENKVNGLCFPPVANSIVVFGLGYGVQMLAAVPWLAEKEIFYWGDIDTHGFAMLSQFRGLYRRTRSLFMDEGTLLRHKLVWSIEPENARHHSPLHYLTDEEQALYQKLAGGILGEGVRLEQERIRFAEVVAKVSA